MSTSFSSGLLAGVTAATIWVCITLWVQLSPAAVGVGGLIFLVATTFVSTLVSGAVARGRAARV